MTPESFRTLLDHETRDAPAAPLPGHELVVGRRRLRRRRLGATLAIALVVAGTTLTLRPGAGGGDDVVVDPSSDAAVLQKCLDSTPARYGDVLTRSGSPVLEASARTDLQIVAAISSADGTVWGKCWIWLQPQASGETGAGMELFDATRSSSGPPGGWSFGTGCGVPETQQHGCDLWEASGADRLPPVVAAVRFDLGDGSSVTVPTHGGYYVLNVLHPLPPGGRVNRNGFAVGFDWATQMTYVAADGTPLAAARLDWQSNDGHTDVPGLAPISDYRSLGRPLEP